MKKNFTPEDELLFLALGGSGEIGMNVNLYGCQGRWIMVDLGMTFSGGQYPGVDLVFADLEFIEDRAKDLEAIVLTGGLVRSRTVVSAIRNRISSLGPVVVYKKTMEMDAMAQGAWRVLVGKEKPKNYALQRKGR